MKKLKIKKHEKMCFSIIPPFSVWKFSTIFYLAKFFVEIPPKLGEWKQLLVFGFFRRFVKNIFFGMRNKCVIYNTFICREYFWKFVLFFQKKHFSRKNKNLKKNLIKNKKFSENYSETICVIRFFRLVFEIFSLNNEMVFKQNIVFSKI